MPLQAQMRGGGGATPIISTGLTGEIPTDNTAASTLTFTVAVCPEAPPKVAVTGCAALPNPANSPVLLNDASVVLIE
jgi:hypothetical protein